MRKGSLWALIVTALLTVGLLGATGAFSLFVWALALNGFMGQERAVNASMITFFVLAGIATLACLASATFAVYHLSVKRMWNAAGAAASSIIVFTVLGGGLQLLAILISSLVADQMRTSR